MEGLEEFLHSSTFLDFPVFPVYPTSLVTASSKVSHADSVASWEHAVGNGVRISSPHLVYVQPSASAPASPPPAPLSSVRLCSTQPPAQPAPRTRPPTLTRRFPAIPSVCTRGCRLTSSSSTPPSLRCPRRPPSRLSKTSPGAASRASAPSSPRPPPAGGPLPRSGSGSSTAARASSATARSAASGRS